MDIKSSVNYDTVQPLLAPTLLQVSAVLNQVLTSDGLNWRFKELLSSSWIHLYARPEVKQLESHSKWTSLDRARYEDDAGARRERADFRECQATESR